MSEQRPLVLYHAGCWDGFASAWVARKALGEIEAVPVNYGEPPPDVTGRNVFILDFGYKAEVMMALAKVARQILVLDHHKTAEADLRRLPELYDGTIPATRLVFRFDMKKSGGRLTWERFFPRQPSPWLVDFTEDRDLWTWKLPQSREVNAALRSFPLDFSVWDCLELRTAQQMAVEGEGILRREKQIVDAHVGFAREMELDGHKILAVNATVLTSEIAGELAKGRPFGACFFERADGCKIWSLRSAEDGIDVSDVAKRHGGGGHPHAAGYEVASS